MNVFILDVAQACSTPLNTPLLFEDELSKDVSITTNISNSSTNENNNIYNTNNLKRLLPEVSDTEMQPKRKKF